MSDAKDEVRRSSEERVVELSLALSDSLSQSLRMSDDRCVNISIF